jgi:hypothetical protein
MAMSKRISENSITSEAPITLYTSSKDVAFLDPRKYRAIEGKIISNSLGSNLLDSLGIYINTDVPGEEFKGNDVPQLEDIEILENTTYKDDKGVTRGRIVLRVRNSSGQNLLGVDARKAVLASAGGQS